MYLQIWIFAFIVMLTKEICDASKRRTAYAKLVKEIRESIEDSGEIQQEIASIQKQYDLINGKESKVLKMGDEDIDKETLKSYLKNINELKMKWQWQAADEVLPYVLNKIYSSPLALREKEDLNYFKAILTSIKHPEDFQAFGELQKKINELSQKSHRE